MRPLCSVTRRVPSLSSVVLLPSLPLRVVLLRDRRGRTHSARPVAQRCINSQVQMCSHVGVVAVDEGCLS